MTKILVIDDEGQVRASIEDLLKMENYEVITAANGLIGVWQARQELPDLIICDISMPELDGYEVITLLHQDPRTRAIPFIFLTAKLDQADYRHGMNLGADDYIAKPFGCDSLLHAISTRISRLSN